MFTISSKYNQKLFKCFATLIIIRYYRILRDNMNLKKGLLVKFDDGDFKLIEEAARQRRISKAALVRMMAIKQMQLEQANGDLHE